MIPASIPPIFVPASSRRFTPSDLIGTPANEIVFPEAKISTTYKFSNHLSDDPRLTPCPDFVMLPFKGLTDCPATEGMIS